MSGSEVRVKVTLSVVSVEKMPTPRPVVAGWGPTIAYREKLFAGRILVCENPIQPGEVGEAIVGVITLSPEDLGMDEGDPVLNRFQIRLLTEGSGTQILSTTFAQWSAREALRRAQSLTLFVRFAPRQR